ncbi:stage II sporulation protein D [Paenibacillus sp. J5C_2022]|uniref:stage II sporulation protein D n=1 Tax=Paenibacillus sp. J5C2022 TaxID=2977129 RepID=UPI0021D3584C|nr:stage II sporulation protein D [Paenibacillus sp. J5C2022]MCU6708478.1 stage II sporulation protein D [Paenibacillus sp. J5C2022]
MRGKESQSFARVPVVGGVGSRDWWVVFGVGILLGAAILSMKLLLTETDAGPSRARLEAQAVTGVKSLAQPGLPLVEVRAQPAPGRGEENEGDRQEQGVKDVQAVTKPPVPSPLDQVVVQVYRTASGKVERVALEQYVQGVLAGEMPASFEMEALKAQAIAARTYIMRRLLLSDRSGMEGKRGDVTDSVQHQVYLSEQDLAAKWPEEEREDNWRKLKRAADETKGQLLMYRGEPVQAFYFSTSNGYTENSEDYWGSEIPYLRSVASPWDEGISPRYEAEISLTLKDFYRKLGISGKAASAKLNMKVVERTEGNRILAVKINGETFAGRELREKLELNSTAFQWQVNGDRIVIKTQGFGHGVGMSQWGANGMAMQGGTAEDILHHYYKDTSVEEASKLAMKLLQPISNS